MNRGRLLKVVITLVLVGAAVTLVAMSGMGSSALYKHVDEVAKDPKAFDGKLLKLHGKVVPGTIEHVDPTTGRTVPTVVTGEQRVRHSFDLSWEGHVISVEQDGGEFPPTILDGTELVATGRLLNPDHFRSTELSTKCASKYKEGPAQSGM